MLLSLSAMFTNEFTLDWLIEITDFKATQILKAVEYGIKQRWIESVDSGKYRFINIKKKAELVNLIDKEQQTNYRRMIADQIVRDYQDKEEAAIKAAQYLLHLSNDEIGCRQLMMAGEVLRRTHDLPQALTYYKKVIEDTQLLKNEEAFNLYYDAVIAYSKIVEISPDISELIPLLKKGIEQAIQRKDKIRIAMLEIHLAKNEWFCTNYNDAIKHFDQGWKVAEQEDNFHLTSSVNIIAAFFLYVRGRYREAIQVYEGVIKEEAESIGRQIPLLLAQFVGACYAYSGQITRGMGMLDTVYSHSVSSGDFLAGSYAGYHIGSVLLELGRIGEAIQYLEEAMEHAKKAPNELAYIATNVYLSTAYYYQGDIETSTSYLRNIIKSWEQVTSLVFYNVNHIVLVLFWEMYVGRYPRIIVFEIDQLIKDNLNSKDPFPRGIAYRYRALLEKRQKKDPKTIIESLKLSEKFLKESGHEIQLVWTRSLLARMYFTVDDKNKARDVIKQSSDNLLDSCMQNIVPADLRSLIKDLRTDKNLLKEIMKMGQELVTIHNDGELIRRILAAVNRILVAERSAIFLLDIDLKKPKLMLRAAQNLTEEDIERDEFKLSRIMIQEAVDTGSFRSRSMKPIAGPDSLSDTEIRSCICVPLTLRDLVTGALYIDNRFFPNAFRESDSEILEYFASQAAIALDNAAVHERNQQLIQRLEGENQYLEAQHLGDLSAEGFVGTCKATRRVFSDVKQVADTDSTVLILGETGVGKELIARALHQGNSRKNGPFIRVNCSAFSDTLIKAELFGHEKGAFTGATERRIGRFELADGGTLFLDEIGDIAMEVQVSLLRVLQNHEFERVGGKRTIHSNFRLLTATNRNLEHAVRDGVFREDLYYRLNVFPIHIPPLRERKEDIPLLVSHFLKAYSEKLGKSLTGISQNNMDRLIAYHWPGNVRELENVIERSAILSSGDQLQLPVLGKAIGTKDPEGRDLLIMEEAIRQHIIEALKRSGGKVRGKGGAAELLDMKHNTLFSRMRKLGIKRTDIINL